MEVDTLRENLGKTSAKKIMLFISDKNMIETDELEVTDISDFI